MKALVDNRPRRLATRRSSRRTGTTRSCSTTRSTWRSCARTYERIAARLGGRRTRRCRLARRSARRDRSRADAVRPVGRRGAGRADFATIAALDRAAARTCSTSVAATAACSPISPRERGATRLRHRDRRRRRARERAATASTCCRATSSRGLAGFDDASFDCVILSQTLQAMRHTEDIVAEMLRVGREAIVTFPNFGHWSHRWQILQRTDAGVRRRCRTSGTTRPTSISARSPISMRSCASAPASSMNRVVLAGGRRGRRAAQPAAASSRSTGSVVREGELRTL